MLLSRKYPQIVGNVNGQSENNSSELGQEIQCGCLPVSEHPHR